MAPSGADRTAERLALLPGIRRAPTSKLQQFMLAGFLDPATCAGLMAQIDRDVRPSTIADPNGDEAFRTSTTCDLDHRDPLVRAVNARLHDITGIPLDHGEPLQGQRYDVGQEFKAHTDYFDPHGADWETYCAVPGQRTWTLMVYLNQPAAGRKAEPRDAPSRDEGAQGPQIYHHQMVPRTRLAMGRGRARLIRPTVPRRLPRHGPSL